MIWMIITEAEMGDGSQHVFHFNEEALGRDNIKLAVVDENDELDFISQNDIVISRTFNRKLIEKIKYKGVKNTSENFLLYELVKDKVILSDFLQAHGILTPKKYSIGEVKDGVKYFVKPRFGQDSLGITTDCICRSKADVIKQVDRIRAELNQDSIIEDFIDGTEYTVACVNNGTIVQAYAIEMDCSKAGGIQTYASKDGYEEYCSAVHDVELKKTAIDIFKLLGLKHHARMDFRKDINGVYYLIDINLLPGLGPLADYAKCLLLSGNISYVDALKSIVNSASKN